MRSYDNKEIERLYYGYEYVDDHVDNLFTSVIPLNFSTRFIQLKAIKRVIFNNPATIILWENGKKTVVKVQEGDKYDKRVGFLMCYLKGIVGNKTLLKEVEKWLSEKE